MKRTALKIAYIGTNFHGFQRQPDLRTVEGELIYVLQKLEYIDDLKKSRFRIAGRTDTGVHSLGNVISFQTEKELHINQINNHLPDDIQIIGTAPVRYGFKPRYAKQRYYRYILLEENMNIDLIKECAEIFEGTHNFLNFSKRKQKTPVRTIDKINIITPEFNNFHPIFIDIYGESFLWNMVRKMARIFQLIGLEKIKLDDVESLLEPKNEKASIKVMPANQLILMDTEYEGIKFKKDDYATVRFERILKENILQYQLNKTLMECLLKSFN